ncbi:MAG: hypothetical protein CMH52_01670 [Myxococcales bacterium]|nr:hypothetical protein [Myxococcales bacterium]
MEHLGPYKIIRNIASGGMGEVYLAALERTGGFEKTVALKCILPRLMGEQRFIDLFEREARLAAVLSHRNIVQIFDFGRSDDRAWLAMEYVQGVDLKRLARRVQSLPLNLIVEIGIQCARGLHYAHRAKDTRGHSLNIIHRDVSPQNILLSYQGDVKIADFGLAHAAAQGIDDDGVLKGKFGYMSPEQALAKPLDERTDQFSLGIVLFELLTGVRAFYDSEGASTTLSRIRDGRLRASLSDVQPKIPQTIRLCIERTLSTDRRDRFADMGQFAATLESAAQASGLRLGVSQLGEWLRATLPEQDDVSVAEAGFTGEGTAVAADPILTSGLPTDWGQASAVSATDDTFAASLPGTGPLIPKPVTSARATEPSDSTPSQFSATLLDVESNSSANAHWRLLIMGILLGLSVLMLVYSGRDSAHNKTPSQTADTRSAATGQPRLDPLHSSGAKSHLKPEVTNVEDPRSIGSNRPTESTKPIPSVATIGMDERAEDNQPKSTPAVSPRGPVEPLKFTKTQLNQTRPGTRVRPVKKKSKSNAVVATNEVKQIRQRPKSPTQKKTKRKEPKAPVEMALRKRPVVPVKVDQTSAVSTVSAPVVKSASDGLDKPTLNGPRLRPGTGGTRFRTLGKGPINGWYELSQSGRLLTAKSPDGLRLIVRVFNRNSRFSAAIHSKPSGELTINGTRLGETPIASAPLSTGTHRVRVQTADGRQMSVVFRLAK